MYYNQYQNIATKFDGLKSILNENLPVTSVEDKDVETSELVNETLSESLLFTTPDATDEPTALVGVSSMTFTAKSVINEIISFKIISSNGFYVMIVLISRNDDSSLRALIS